MRINIIPSFPPYNIDPLIHIFLIEVSHKVKSINGYEAEPQLPTQLEHSQEQQPQQYHEPQIPAETREADQPKQVYQPPPGAEGGELKPGEEKIDPPFTARKSKSKSLGCFQPKNFSTAVRYPAITKSRPISKFGRVTVTTKLDQLTSIFSQCNFTMTGTGTRDPKHSGTLTIPAPRLSS